MARHYKLRDRAVPQQSTAQFVAVQGLWAHPEFTWKKHGVSWLEDLLPQDFPNAHIRSFGPDKAPFEIIGWLLSRVSSVSRTVSIPLLLGIISFPRWRRYLVLLAFANGSIAALLAFVKYALNISSTEWNDVEALAERLLEEMSTNYVNLPTVLIGHSLGGLIIKKALVMAKEHKQKYAKILESVQGIVFLGTPHRGSNMASLLEQIPVGPLQRKSAILGTNSTMLAELDADFGAMLTSSDRPIQIYSFYESRPSAFGITTVSQQSASLPGHPAFALQADHSGLNKFASIDDADYRMIVRRLKESSLIFSPS